MNWKSLWPYIVILFLIGIVLMFVPYWITRPNTSGIDFSDTGQIGDTIGGITAPFIGFLGVVFTFLAFWIQYEANKDIKKDISKDRFETRFYELLRLHQHNVSDIDINSTFSGRKAFVRMYYEIRFIYAYLLQEIEEWNKTEEPKVNMHSSDYMELAYTIFFFGVDELKKGFEENFAYAHNVHSPFVVQFVKSLIGFRKGNEMGDKTGWDLKVLKGPMNGTIWTPSYKPFEGHVSKLGHYYRHLYQLVKYVSSSKIPGFGFHEKYGYIKILRAQLSNHEQTLIYFNSFFGAGRIWWKETNEELKNDRGEILSYFLDYRIIKNLPFNLTRFGPKPKEEFAKALESRGRSDEEIKEELAELFEWIGG